MADKKRYTLVLPNDLYDQVEQYANENQTTVVDVIRRSLKLSLFVEGKIKSGYKVIIRKDGKDQEVIFL